MGSRRSRQLVLLSALGATACSLLAPLDEYASGGPLELERDLVGHWRLDEGGGTMARDSSGQHNHGMLVNLQDTDWVKAGRVGGALQFADGRRPHVLVANAPSLNPRANAVSAAAWVNANTWCGSSGSNIARRVLQKGEDNLQYRLLCESGKLMWNAGGGTVTAELPRTGQWHHVAGTSDGRTVALYLGGKEVATAPAGGAMTETRDPLFIGAKNGGGFFFHGLLDEVLLYARALTAAEVQALAAGRRPEAP